MDAAFFTLITASLSAWIEPSRVAVRTPRLGRIASNPANPAIPAARPKVDLAAEVARALFENDAEAIYAAFQKVLRKGSPYAFQVLSDRAFGKMKETVAHEHSPYEGQSDADLEAKVRKLEEKLGYRSPAPKVLPPSEDTPKLN